MVDDHDGRQNVRKKHSGGGTNNPGEGTINSGGGTNNPGRDFQKRKNCFCHSILLFFVRVENTKVGAGGTNNPGGGVTINPGGGVLLIRGLIQNSGSRIKGGIRVLQNQVT